jgi:uncharacterized protein YigE (DUF2233 family)
MPRKRVFILLAVVLLIAGVGYWFWSTKHWSGEQLDRQRVSDQVELVIAVFRHPDSEEVSITAVRCDPQNNKLSIDFDSLDQESNPREFLSIAARQDAAAMINGGYFDASFQPVGLVVKDGHSVSAISKQPALSGVFAIHKGGGVQLIPRDSYRPDDSIESAIQAGPFIVDPGSKAGIRSDDLKQAQRTAIGQTLSGEIVFISTTPCTLYELSEILTHHPDKLGVIGFDRVLNLDGGPSTGLYLQSHEEYQVVPETAVPNTILMHSRWR